MAWWGNIAGTALGYFRLGLSGVRLKNSAGDLLVRNTGDTADAAITTSKANVSGDAIDINSDAAGSGADWKYTIQRPATGMTAAVSLTLPADDGAAGQVLSTDGSGVLSWALAGKAIQTAHTQSGAVLTGTTIIPHDDTIPQNTEGTEALTLSITPTDAANILQITTTIVCASSNNGEIMAVALFRDSGAGAIAAAASSQTNLINRETTISFTHRVTAGSTAATTFKVRFGGTTAGTFTLNGVSGGRIFGGVMASSMSIVEYKP